MLNDASAMMTQHVGSSHKLDMTMAIAYRHLTHY